MGGLLTFAQARRGANAWGGDSESANGRGTSDKISRVTRNKGSYVRDSQGSVVGDE